MCVRGDIRVRQHRVASGKVASRPHLAIGVCLTSHALAIATVPEKRMTMFFVIVFAAHLSTAASDTSTHEAAPCSSRPQKPA